MRKFLNLNLNTAYYFLVVFLPISWVSLIGVGELSFKLMHLSFIPLLICLLFKEFRTNLLDFIKDNKYLISFFILLMIMNFVSVCLNTYRSPSAVSYIAKNIIYFSFFLMFGGLIISLAKSVTFHKHITISNTICILFFICIATIAFKAQGHSFLGDLINFFLKGDSNALRFALFKTLFNSSQTSSDSDLSTNLLNTLIGSFIFVHFTSLYAYKNVKSKFLKALNVLCIIFSAFMVIASVSRSNILVMIAGYIIYWGFDIFYNKNQRRVIQVISTLVIIGLFVLLFWTKIEDIFSGASTMIISRFSNLDENNRWALNAQCVTSFTENMHNFLIGKGSGAIVLYGTTAHNFILGSAYQAGIFGLVLSILFYFGLIYSLFRDNVMLAKHPHAFIIGSLMAAPLLRTMESGGAGSLTMQEWFCLAFFLGFILQKKKEMQFMK